ncbi:MAG: putative lipid II flippase FtsW [Deferribacteraceae bacterium]|jgi:cell division protein FtsW|nr:putative lipid II flippase FtsW [Deferribacteraceae bacterium]
MINYRDPRFHLFFIAFVLSLTGLLFSYSAGSLQAMRLGRSDTYFLMKQLLSCVLGFICMFAAYKIPLEFYRKKIVFLFFGTLILLIAVFFQREANGAHRWIMLPVFSFQPSELAKFTVVVYLAHYLDKKYDKMADFTRGFLPATIMVGTLAALIMLEPDFGTTVLITSVAFTVLIIGGAKGRHVMGILGFLLPLFIASLFLGYRRGRLLMFLDPWADRLGSGYQLVQSLSAVGSGGVYGKGIGNSTQKLFFLPEAHTDFVYAIISEETGILGAMAVALAITLFFRIAVKAALKQRDRYKKLVLIGVSCMLFYQSVINIGVVLGILPTKGITLPFISYGGSALMIALFFVGILLRGIEESEESG